MSNESLFEVMQRDILNAPLDEANKNKLLQNVLWMKDQEINILITGATGSGKSSTINALFSIDSGAVCEVAKVGAGVDPETTQIQKYKLHNMTLWDTPGLGDGKEADRHHAKAIIDKLHERGKDGNALIDLVLVILDGSTKDLGTSYELINSVIIPNLGEGGSKRLLVALNQADAAMGGRNWDRNRNEPNPRLVSYLEDKVASVKRRIKEATGVDTDPVYYSAGFKEEGIVQEPPYNLSKLLYYIVKATPAEKRPIYVDNVNRDPKMWKDDDKKQPYNVDTAKSIWQSVVDGASLGAKIGGTIGSFFGPTFSRIGRWGGGVIGGIWGGICGAL